jgi:hypothetical protein
MNSERDAVNILYSDAAKIGPRMTPDTGVGANDKHGRCLSNAPEIGSTRWHQELRSAENGRKLSHGIGTSKCSIRHVPVEPFHA